jgi:hypothetical protein
MNHDESSLFEIAQRLIEDDVFAAMEERPWQTLGVAFAVGFFATQMFQRGSKDDLQRMLKRLTGAMITEGLMTRAPVELH